MRRRHRRLQSEAELDITAFMNLMIVLVPVLLLSMVFAHTTVLQLNFPELDGSAADQAEQLQLQVIILDDKLVVADSQGGVIKQIPDQEKQHDYKLLAQVMKDVKARLPDKKDVTIMAKQDTSYQTLITVMDTVRSYEAVVAGSVVDAELFPEISIADAPKIASS
ncbi:biopolymer transporter ExbD [Marinobacteraceae bacterium S3BR75-40.1]